jgi:hypothetical protein
LTTQPPTVTDPSFLADPSFILKEQGDPFVRVRHCGAGKGGG